MSELILSGTLLCLEGLTILRLRTSFDAGYLAAVDEHDIFEIKENGTFGTVEDSYDDRLMTRAIDVYIVYKMLLPKKIKVVGKKRHIVKSAASI